MKTRLAILSASAGILLFSATAQAQTGTLPVQNMNFDLWCQEQQHLPPSRCDKRTPEDEATFEAYRAKIEKYEVPYLQNQDAGQRFNNNVLHADPVDRNNAAPDPAPATQPPPR
jgi:hypothetical protein